jgi:hypothetical protein
VKNRYFSELFTGCPTDINVITNATNKLKNATGLSLSYCTIPVDPESS